MGIFNKTTEDKAERHKSRYDEQHENAVDLAKNLGITLTDMQIASMIAGMRMPTLSQESEERLVELTKDRRLKSKALRLEAFKAMPASMRQYLVNSLTWSTTIGKMNYTSMEFTVEEAALWGLKQKYQRIFEQIHMHPSYINTYQCMMSADRTPAVQIAGETKYANITLDESVFTLEDILKAHAEQCADDSLSGDLDK